MTEIPFRCPLCEAALTLENKSYICPNRHTFDVSREGYVNFAVGKSESGDDDGMCAGRHRFLSAGYYRPFAEWLAQTVKEYAPDASAVVDCGCGEGYYLRNLRNVFPHAALFGVDLAKSAVKMAAKAEKGAETPCHYAVCSLFTLPLFDACADVAISVFAPVASKETARVLKNDGYLFVAGPAPRHLAGLKKCLYDTPYDNPEKHFEYDEFAFVGEKTLDYTVIVAGEHVHDLFGMTPYYWKTSRQDSEKLDGIDRLETELSFKLSVYRKKTSV